MLLLSYTPTSHHDTYPFVRPKPNSPVSGKNVFITGASKGIGRALALSYARSGVSALVLTARSSLDTLISEVKDVAKEVGVPAPKIFTYAMDVTDQVAIQKAAEQAAKDLDGRLDVLINNAGYLETSRPIAESDPDEYWKTWTVNMQGPYLVTRALLPLMLKGGEKTIVNLSSIGALTIRPGGSAYQMTKLAICRFSEFLDAEYGDQGLLAFAVHPGGIMTELASNLPNHMHGREQPLPPYLLIKL